LARAVEDLQAAAIVRAMKHAHLRVLVDAIARASDAAAAG
jgi:hypothetical protein